MARVETNFGLVIDTDHDTNETIIISKHDPDSTEKIELFYDQWQELMTFVPLVMPGWKD